MALRIVHIGRNSWQVYTNHIIKARGRSAPVMRQVAACETCTKTAIVGEPQIWINYVLPAVADPGLLYRIRRIAKEKSIKEEMVAQTDG
jgi:hypothetical protein